MDLGEYRHLSEHDEPTEEAEDLEVFAPISNLRTGIKRKPVITSPVELLSRFQYVSHLERQDRDTDESQPFIVGLKSKLEIQKKRVSTSSIELASLNSNQMAPRHHGYEDSFVSLVLSNSDEKETSQKWKWRSGMYAGSGSRPAWFTTVAIGLLIAIIVLLVNISILIWTYIRFLVKDSTAIVYNGSCSKTSTMTATAELIINILSTLLLAASNNCGQLLLSPTRAEVNKAHTQGTWIHIGVASARNFPWIGKWRIAIWAVLFASSVPLHLLYNSVFYSSTYTNDWLAAAVTEDFLNGGFWNQTIANATFTSRNKGTAAQAFLEIVSEMQGNTSSLIKLTNDECQSAYGRYGTPVLESPYLNVIIVTNYTSKDSFIDGMLDRPEWDQGSSWFDMINMTVPAVANSGSNMCSVDWDYSDGTDWGLPVCSCSGVQNQNCVITERAYVQECLAQPASDFEAQCTLSISVTLLIAVIVCNAFKAICLASTLMSTSFHPLATVGDAVTSYMEQPDSTTVACGPLSLSTIGKIYSKKKEPYSLKIKTLKGAYVWKSKEKGKRWAHAIGATVCFFAFLLWGFMAWVALAVNLSQSWTSEIILSWYHYFNYTINEGYTAGLHPSSLAGNVLLVNSPQLAVSLIYVLYNSVFTRMLVAYEYSKFGLNRKSLRVSRPTGTQRSTLWLQIPYRYIIPMMSCMSLIHFFISRGIYLVNVRVYDISGQEVPDRRSISHGTSALALLVAFGLGTIMLCAFLACMFRTLGLGIPIIGSNSVAISSACHPVVGDGDAATKPLMYGVVDASPGDTQGEDRGEMKHVCFSSFEVEPLEDSMKYYQIKHFPPPRTQLDSKSKKIELLRLMCFVPRLVPVGCGS